MYTIKSMSDDGTYFLSANWRKNKALWVKQSSYKERMLFKSINGAKQSLKSLLETMTEYAEDEFCIVEWVGNKFKEIEKLTIDVEVLDNNTIVNVSVS